MVVNLEAFCQCQSWKSENPVPCDGKISSRTLHELEAQKPYGMGTGHVAAIELEAPVI
ncbi:hypothetical protein LTR36_008986 [Oleoguttula mirabilis]|uniref:Uncharacterized protein n=1 Tax=Oleoguttula mirabilis TaxID=1507867 RepID=A0AAV9J6T6_9PEZI|nr:hypothetical protein LTR36_008986 [Oleoguttula mirabilis]